jgi:polysaccharide biosynthesis/export protein
VISAEEAIAKAGGLQDQRADPAGVFVFRYEPANIVDQLAPNRANGGTNPVPVVYHLDMSRTGSYFLARRFDIHNKDIVYAANAEFNEVQKFLNLLGSVLSPAATGASVSAVLQ